MSDPVITPATTPATTPLPVGEAQSGATQGELDRVREIILGPDSVRQRLRQAEVDRLRDIIVGPQIEEYERRFADMKRLLDHMSSDLRTMEERIGEFEKSISRRTEALELDVRKLNDDFRRELERQRTREGLMQQLAIQVRQHEEAIVGVNEGVNDLRKGQAGHDADIRTTKIGLVEARDHLEQRSQAIRREIRSTEDAVRADLRRLIDRLNDQKTDRKALASMLIEVATRLETGNSVSGLLEGLSGSKE